MDNQKDPALRVLGRRELRHRIPYSDVHIWRMEH